MERLTNFWGNLKKCVECEKKLNCYSNQSCGHIAEGIAKLRDYEELEEQGKLLKLPCAVGDTVWCVQMHSGGGRVPNWGEVHQSKFSIRMYDDFGKTVFLTKEEAEAALKELERG